MRYPLVIFDLDGTLADSFPWFLRVMNEVAREFGFRAVAPEEIDDLRRAGARDILRRLDVPLWKLPAIAARMRALKRAHLADIPLFAGVPEMLQALASGGVRLALVSSDSEANARHQLGAANAALFQAFDCGASLFGKAAKFSRVLKRAGLTPQQAITIGDEIRDAEAARAANVAFGAVAWGYAHRDALQRMNPDRSFASVPDIAEQLLLAEK